MCDPVSIGSAIATVVGTELQASAQRKAQKGIQSAIRNNDNANDALRAQSQTKVLDQTDQFSREKFDRTQAAETANIKANFDKQNSAGELPGEYYGGQQGENTRRYTEIKGGEAKNFTQQMSDALANLRGFDQAQGTNTRGIQRAGEVVSINQNREAGNNAVLPLQIEAAKQKGQSPLGDILTAGGSAGLTAGLSGAGGSFTQGGLSRTLAGTPYGPVNGFAGTGFSLS